MVIISINHGHDDIILMMVMAGFLELINNMLTSGMVPALYADDEKEAIIGQVGIQKSGNRYSMFFDNNKDLDLLRLSVFLLA